MRYHSCLEYKFQLFNIFSVQFYSVMLNIYHRILGDTTYKEVFIPYFIINHIAAIERYLNSFYFQRN